MAIDTTKELVEYYVNLLIKQYRDKPKARATIAAQATPIIMPQTTVQEIQFREAPGAGAFVLSYNGVTLSAINWNDSSSTIQTLFRAQPGLDDITVTGAISDLKLVVTFIGVPTVAELFELVSSTLDTGSPILIETDETLPLAVQNGFNLTGDNTAVGVQLDILAKYLGVKRTAAYNQSQITLSDDDFLTLMLFAARRNTMGSSLADIWQLIEDFFPDQISVYDYRNMFMSYFIDSAIGSQDLPRMLLAQDLLPRPMTVGLSVIYAPFNPNSFFAMRTYTTDQPAGSSTMNTYTNYETDKPWLSYKYAI